MHIFGQGNQPWLCPPDVRASTPFLYSKIGPFLRAEAEHVLLSVARYGGVLAWGLLLSLGCQTKEVPQRAEAGGSTGTNVARTDAPVGVSDGGLSPSEVCLSADAPKRAPGQACACPGDCTTGTCQQGVCCSGAACGAKRAAGSVCDEPGDCESGFCSDGVCCNVACTGACVSCNQPDRMGDCIPAPAGARGSAQHLPRGRARDLRAERVLQWPGRLYEVRRRDRVQAGRLRRSRPVRAAERVRRRRHLPGGRRPLVRTIHL